MNINKKKYLLFPKPNLKHLLFLFYFVSSVIKQTILKNFKDEDSLAIPVFKLYLYDIGDFLSLIPYLILKKKSKSDNDITQSTNDNNKEKEKEKENPSMKDTEKLRYIYIDFKSGEFESNKKRSYIYILIISILDFIAQISTVIFYLALGDQHMAVPHGNLTFILIFNIIFLFLLTKFIMNITFYLHHYFSFIIFIICLIVIVIIDFIEIKRYSNNFINSLLYVVIRIFVVLLYSITDILDKVVFLKYFITPYFLLLSKAILQFFCSILFSIPLFFVKFKIVKDGKMQEELIFSMIDDIFFEKKIYILLYIVYLINSFFYNILNYLIIDKFFPTHTAIARIFENFGILLINIISNSLKNYIPLRIIMYILLLFAAFIYNEFFVINICGLANGTKLFLDYKEKNEFSFISETNTNEHLIKIVDDQDSININEQEHDNSIELANLNDSLII